MSLSISAQDLQSLLGGELRNVQPKECFSGVRSRLEQVRGGELFVLQRHDSRVIREALDRGVAFCLTDRAEGPERTLVVPEPEKALFRLVQWWRERVPVPLAAVVGTEGKTTVAALSAAMLLAVGRGLYFLEEQDRLTAACCLCELHHQHKWAVVELPLDPDLLKLFSPAVIAVSGERAEDPCSFLQRLSFLSGILRVRDGNVLMERPAGGSPDFARVIGCETRGLDGIVLKMSLGGEKTVFALPLLGSHNGGNAALAVSVAKSIFPGLSLDQAAGVCERFIVPPHRMSLVRTAVGHTIVDDTLQPSAAALRAAAAFVAALKNEECATAFVVGWDGQVLDEASANEFCRMLLNKRPSVVVTVGEKTYSFFSGLKQTGIPVVPAPAPETAAHAVEKFKYNLLFVFGSPGMGLDRTVERLLELEGELIPKGTLS